MIKRAFKFGLFGLAGAALMGCSDVVTQDIHPLKIKPHFTECTDPDVSADIEFKSGLDVSLPQDLILQVDGEQISKKSSSFKDVEEMILEIPVGSQTDVSKCNSTQQFNIYSVELPKPREGSNKNLSMFTPVYSLNYAFANVPKSEMDAFFQTMPEVLQTLEEFEVSVFKTNGNPPSGYRQRFSESQIKRQQTIKVNPQFLLQVPYVGRICRIEINDCAFFEIVYPGLNGSDKGAVLHVYLSIDSNIIIKLETAAILDDPKDLESWRLNDQILNTMFEVKDYIINSNYG